jgi:hypothetical protein
LEDLPAHNKQEIYAWVMGQLESSGLPAPDNIVLLRRKAGGAIESDCQHIAQRMGASVVMCDLTSKMMAWAYPQ